MAYDIHTSKGQSIKGSAPHAKAIVTCGIHMNNDMAIQVFTNEERSAGYVIWHNLDTGTRRFERLKVYRTEREKYGRTGGYWKSLPILIH